MVPVRYLKLIPPLWSDFVPPSEIFQLRTFCCSFPRPNSCCSLVAHWFSDIHTHSFSVESAYYFQENFLAGFLMAASWFSHLAILWCTGIIHPLPRETQTSPNLIPATPLAKQLDLMPTLDLCLYLQESLLKIPMVLMKCSTLGMFPIPCPGQGQISLHSSHQRNSFHKILKNLPQSNSCITLSGWRYLRAMKPLLNFFPLKIHILIFLLTLEMPVIPWFLSWNFQLQKEKHKVIYYSKVILKYFTGTIFVFFQIWLIRDRNLLSP